MQDAMARFFWCLLATLSAVSIAYGIWVFCSTLHDVIFDNGYRKGWRDGWDDANSVLDEVSKQKGTR